MQSAQKWMKRGGALVLVTATALVLPAAGIAQQDAQARIATQKVAMQKLAFLVGRWQGPVTVLRGAKEPLHMTQTENVEWKVDGLVLLIQGKSTDAAGKTEFSALATVAYDVRTKTYHMRAYSEGYYVDSELTVKDHGFEWGFPTGPGRLTNSMRLTATGEWYETTDFTVSGGPPRRSMEMTLMRQP